MCHLEVQTTGIPDGQVLTAYDQRKETPALYKQSQAESSETKGANYPMNLYHT